ncbi:MAG: DEAD/DEAH box helicase [Synergistaceae bacterium]|nr:DEAD/DEAH box helicase [Synergistaceae bacterium]
MSKITIDTNLSKNEIYLVGDISALRANRYAVAYMKEYLAPTFQENKINIAIKDNNAEELLSNIHNMLKKYGFEEQLSETTQRIFTDYYEEENKFIVFSNEALKIKNNECNLDDFKRFSNSLVKHLTKRSLYPLQLLSAYHLAFSQNACNFSVPGSGKTSIVYAAFSYLKNLPENDPRKINKLLIVGPLSSFGPWELEYKECFGIYPNVKRLTSNLSYDYKADYLKFRQTAELILISYASLVSLQEDIIFFLKYNQVMVVLDEAHKAKNTTGGAIANSVLTIAKYCKSRVVLTGTPAPNGYEDLFNVFKFIWPSKNVVGFGINQLREMSGQKYDKRTSRLIDNISPFFIRIKKSDLGIPEAKSNELRITMGPLQQKIYDFIEKRYVGNFLQESQLNAVAMFKSKIVNARMIRLMQAATNPSMLKEPLKDFFGEMLDIPINPFNGFDDSDVIAEILKYSENELPSKYLAALNLTKKILSNGGKVVIWANFIHTINDLKQFFTANGIRAQELYGATPVEINGINYDEEDSNLVLTREKIVNDFHHDNCPYKVIIANPFAVAESISLHKACHNAIYIERSFNAAHFVQSKDRIHRYGLKPNDETSYYYLISENSIDETINDRLNAKELRMTEIMENSSIPLFDNVSLNFGDEDIKALIRDYVRRTKKLQ